MSVQNKKEEKSFCLETYNYCLPKELIAQYPTKNRDESKLLCYDSRKKTTSHNIFKELPDLLTNNDVLVLNNTKVIPARFRALSSQLSALKEMEILLVSSTSPDNLTWKVLASPRKHMEKTKELLVNVILNNNEESPTVMRSLVNNIPQDDIVPLTPNDLIIDVIDFETIRFRKINDLKSILNNVGTMPLPPYIKRETEEIDTQRYQTVFAKEPGAVAAPTASLHFTEELLTEISAKGVEILYITLHVGPGTFLPIRSDDVREHNLIPEYFHIEEEIWNKILKAKENKKRIIACGTTVVRTLEYAFKERQLSGLNNLYITPGFDFKIIDSMITNFHLPKTSLLVLVSSLIGWDYLKGIYEEAINERYRFFSYGDAMFIN